MKQMLITVAASLSLAACATIPPPNMDTADFGTPMTKDQADGLAREYFNESLKDPDSAHITCGKFDRGWMLDSPIFAKERTYGYQIHCMVNAKNSYGGYTGNKLYRLLFRDNHLVYVYLTNEHGSLERVL